MVSKIISVDITISAFLLMFIGTICQTQICPKECMCKNEFEARCSFDDKVTVIPTTLPSTLKTLWIEGGSINELKNDDIFRFRNLEVIKLLRNNLKIIHPYTFVNMTNLKTIVIRKNLLELLDSHAFGELTNVNDISLEDNRIKCIKKFAFEKSSMIGTINLRRNPTETIETNAFSNLRSVNTIHMPNNVSRIEEDSFSNLIDVHFLHFSLLNMEYLEAEMFRGLGPINSMTIRESRLGLIKSYAFALIKGVKSLTIEKCRIKRIRKNSFANSKQVGFIEVSHNRIQRVERNSTLSSERLLIRKNEIDCQCSNLWIYESKDEDLLKNFCFIENEADSSQFRSIDHRFVEKCGPIANHADDDDYDENVASYIKNLYIYTFIFALYIILSVCQ